jgi:SAM-dependent methyltransferase
MTYAPSTHWDHFFHSHRQLGTDLDWGEQWTGAFNPLLHAHHVQTLLDLGCGTGNDVRRLAQHGLVVVGLDYSQEALTQAAAKAAPHSCFVRADMAFSLPFPDVCFDAVMSNVAIHMFNDALTRTIFCEVKRILRPGGLFLFHVNALEDRPVRAQRKPPLRELEPNYVLESDGQTMHFFSEAYLRELLRDWGDVGLELVEISAGTLTSRFRKYVWRGVVQTSLSSPGTRLAVSWVKG